MLAPARETLGGLGLKEHQALIVCHDDKPHAHVHPGDRSSREHGDDGLLTLPRSA